MGFSRLRKKEMGGPLPHGRGSVSDCKPGTTVRAARVSKRFFVPKHKTAVCRAAHNRGSALLAVLWLSAALSAIAFAMSVTVRGETGRTATSVDDLRSYYLASAGVDKAAMELMWTAIQGSPLIRKDASYVDYTFPSGVAHVEIVPEAAKLNLNRASRDDLFKLLSALGVDPGRATAIAAAIVDWRSPAGAGSAFDSYYLSLTPSFQSPHASFQEIEELLSVRGVTPDIFYGTWAPAGDGDPATQPLVRHAGLNDCLTVYATLAGVDVNSAEPAVLATLGMDAGAIQAILARRAEGSGSVHLLEYVQSGAASAIPQAAGNFQSGSNFQAGGNSQTAGNSMITFRSTARLLLPDGKLSDMRRTVGAQVKYLPWGLEAPYYVMRWYDTAWSH